MIGPSSTTPGESLSRGHAAQAITVTVERTDDGRLRVSCPLLPGWQRVTSSPAELAVIVGREVFTEAEIASYARFRGSVYDAALHPADAFEDDPEPLRLVSQADSRRHPSEPAPELPSSPSWRSDAPYRPDQHAPADWTPLPDGRWQAPGGRKHRPDSALVASVVQRRAALGLPTSA